MKTNKQNLKKTKYTDKLAMFHCELEKIILELLEKHSYTKSKSISNYNCLPIDDLNVSFENDSFTELLVVNNDITLLNKDGYQYKIYAEPIDIICDMLDKLCTKYNFD